jgi:uncharacterized membrane protein (UPF0136 family)
MKLLEYFDRGSQMTANTGWFYGLIIAIAGVLMLNIWVFLFGAFLMIAGKIIERNNRKWRERQQQKAQSKS